MFTNYYKKRSYTFKGFLKDLTFMLRNFSKISEAMRTERINKQFREKIMLAVTAVNDCKYCSFGHTQMALKAGCTEEEINQIMQQDLGACDSYEVVALAYAQHYAETKGNPSPEALKKLFSHYGRKKAEDILLFIHMIEMGNLLGNTIDAFASRLKGKPAEEGSFLFEAVLFASSYPFISLFLKKDFFTKRASLRIQGSP